MTQSTTFAQVANNQFDYLLSTLCANTPPYKKHSSSRKFPTLSISLRLLLVMFLTLTVSASAWGADETLSCSKGTISNNTMTFSTTNFTFVHAKGEGSNFAAYTPWRVYANNTVTITAGSGVASIDKIEIVHNSTYYSTITSSSGSVTMASTSGGTTTINSTSGKTVTLTVTGSSQSRWSSIKVTYTPAASDTKVTVSKGSVSNGSISLNKTSVTTTSAAQSVTVTCTPNTGYYTKSVSATKPATGNTPTYGGSGNSRTVTYSKGSNGSSMITATFAPAWQLRGSFNEWGTTHPLTSFSGSVATITVDLQAMTAYTFKFVNVSGSSEQWYGNSGAIITDISDWEFSTSVGDNARLFTGPAGTYTFKFNVSTKALQVIYPTVTHPAEGYAYFQKQDSWNGFKVYNYTADDDRLSDWDGSPSVTNTTTICGKTYYYTALATQFQKVIFRDNGSNQWKEISVSGYSGKYCGDDYNATPQTWKTFNKYSITFNSNGGSGSMTALSGICPGESQTLTANSFTRAGHTFNGWNTKADGTGTNYADKATIANINSNITLYAKWKANTYTITSNLTNCSSSPAIPASYTYTGSAANLTYTITPESGYRLPDAITVSGCAYTWDKNTGQLKLTGTISGNVTITIEAVKVHTITWKVNKQTYTTGSPTQSIDAGKTYKNLTLPTDPADNTLEECYDDKKFVGWSTINIGSTESAAPSVLFKTAADAPNTAITDNTTLYAVFATETGGGTTTTSESTTLDFSAQGYANQTTISSLTIGDIIATFNKGSNNNDPKYYTTGTAVRVYGGGYFTVTASTGKITEVIITTSSGEDSNTITADCGTYTTNTKTWTGSASSVKFTVGSTSGHRRIKSLAVTYSTTTTSAPTYSHYVTECCTLNNITLDGSGTTTGGTFSATATKACKGEDITLTATAAECYEFVSWTIKKTSDDTDVTNSVLDGNTLTMPDYAVTVYATFKSLSVTEITLSMTGGYKNLDVGETNQLLVTYTPEDATCDTEIVSWTSSNDNILSVSNTGLVTAQMAGDATITAKTAGGVSATYDITVNNPACEAWFIHYWNNNSMIGDECFYKVKPDDPNDHEWRTNNFSLPSFSDEDKFIVNNTPEDSYKADQVFRTGIGFADIQRGGQNCGTNPYPGQDAYGQLSIYDDSETTNRYIAFYPAQYLVTYGKDGTAPWEVLPLNNTTGYEYETEPFMVPNGYKTDDTYKYYVGITDKNGNIKYVGYEFDGVEYKKSSVDPMNTVNGLSASDMAGKWGTWHIYSNSCANNWYCEFIHYYRVEFNLNGGEGDFAPRYGKATTPHVKFTTTDIGAPTRTGYTFLGWKDQNNKIYAPTDATVTINNDLTLTALWVEEYGSNNCRWEEVTIDDIEYGDEVVVVMVHGETLYALPYDSETASKANPLARKITSANLASGMSEDLIWYIMKGDGNTFTLSPKTAINKYLTCNSSNNAVRINTEANRNFTIENDFLKNTKFGTYLAISTAATKDWRHYESTNTTISSKAQTLKFYKKVCLPADEYWINYNLSNVTCTTDPIPSQIANDGEDLLLEFSANDGYKLPETISVKMGETEIGNDENYCVWGKETGALLIAAEQITDNITITIEGCERLAAPENLLATNITSTSAVLSWDAVAKADEYIVFVTDGETNLEIPTTNCTITIEGLSKNTYYLWDVTATADNYCDSKKPSVLTNEFTTLDVYTVTFTPNGGTAVEPQTVEHGGKATKPANPTKTGYTFAGWYTEADTEFNFNTPIESTTTLYAKWNANQYTITFLKQYGLGGTDNATVTFNSNNFSVVTIELPTRDGYEFGGYYTETGGAGLQIVDAEGKWLKNKTGYLDASGNWIKAESVNLYAKWTKIHTITWVVNNNTETPYHTSTVLSGSTIDQLPTPPADDLFADCDVNAFVGWSTDNIGLNPDPTAPTDLFKTVAEAQNKIGAISADKKFYAVYASEVEQIATFEADGLNGLSANSTLKWTHDNSGISLAISAGQRYTGSPKTFTITNGISNYCEIVAPEGKSLKKAVVSITESKYKVNSVSSPWSLSTSNTTQTITTSTNATDLKMYATSSYQIRITQVDVTYTTYSNYITRCTALPDPVWGGATIDKTEIAVNCGETSSTNGAAKISFLKETNFNLYKDITVEVTSGNFIIASSRDGEYTTFVTLSPTQNGENVGTFANKYVYVRAVAPPMSSNQLTGTITISGKQITTQVINVTATVTCNEYTLTFNDCGDTKTISGFAGTTVEPIEPWAETCSEPVQYVFDGWATAPVTNGTEEYEKVDFSTFTMPNNNTTIIYAVYRYAEEGGEPVNGYVKVTESLTDWSGDYVIVDDVFNVAIQNTYEEDTKDNKTLKDVSVTIENDKIVSPTNDIIWTISKSGEYYTVYNAEAIKYAGITKNATRAAGLSETIATGYSMNIIFDSNTKIAKVSSTDYNRCFSYSEAYPEWRTYSNNDANGKTGYLYRFSNKTIRYTSSLVCGSIEAEDAIVTSTVGQTVKVYVPITLGYSGAASITGTSDNEAFTVVTKNDVAVGESTIEVHYQPTAYVHTANQEETATITLTTSNGATTTFNVTGRCLSENFAIVAKVGNVWYALPSQGLNSTTPPTAYPVEVDDMADPTAVTAVPANADWSLRQVYTSSGSDDRFADYGDNLVFVNNASPAMALNASTSGNYLLTDAQYTNYYQTNPSLYEWTPTTTDLETYTLTNAQRTDRTLNVATNTVFGVHSDNKATTEVRFLPIQNRYTPAALQVVEWKENSVVIMYNGDPAQMASVSVNGAAVQNTTLSAAQRDLAVYELAATGLADNPSQRLSITIGTEKTILSIPYIISGSKNDIDVLPGSTVAARQEVAKVSDLVILKGATLTAAGAKGNPYKFRNVTIYGGGKLVVPADNGFGVNSLTLRIGGVTADRNYDYVYPEFVLNTQYDGAYTNTSGKINLDYVTTKDQYYTFVAPFAVQTKDIHYPVDIYGNNVAANNRGSFEFQFYDGAARAAGERGWKVVEEDLTNGATLTAHKGYTFYGMPKKVSVNGGISTRQKFGIHRIPMTETAANVMTHENDEQFVAISAHPSEKNINSGWNLIGNPYMSTITGLDNQSIVTGSIVMVDNRWEWSNEDTYNQRFIVFPSNDGEWYYTSQASNATLPAFKNFFVQIDNEANALSIPYTHRASGSAAPARRVAEDMDKDIELAIVLEQDDKYADQMDFLLNDAYSAVYDRNADFTKMMNNTNLNLFGVHLDDYLSFVAIDTYTARSSVAIGYQVPQAGQYTLRLSDKPYVMWSMVDAIYVTDHEVTPEVTTNLLDEAYTFQVTNAETNTTRFSISIVPSKESGGTTTAIDDILYQDMQTQKIIYNDQLYILRGGVVYDAMGQRVTSINK